MTDADKVMNPQHSGSDPADIRIRVWINPEIRIRITDHFWLRRWRRFALSQRSPIKLLAYTESIYSEQNEVGWNLEAAEEE